MTIEQTLAERGNRYGDFADHAAIAQGLQDTIRTTHGWQRLDATKRQALTVIADKIARILSGDPEYADNWHDIQGYAKLVEDRLGGADSAIDAPETINCRCVSAPITDPEGWIEWKGGECPVPRGTLVDVRYRDSAERHNIPALELVPGDDASYAYWKNEGVSNDIIAYRLSKPAETPWYPDDSGEWIEVKDGKRPVGLRGRQRIAVLLDAEREAREFHEDLWDRTVGSTDWSLRNIVAYKPLTRKSK